MPAESTQEAHERLTAEAVELFGKKIPTHLSLRAFSAVRPEQLEQCVQHIRGFNEAELELLIACVMRSYTFIGHLFVNVDRIRQGDVIRYCVEAVPVAALFYPQPIGYKPSLHILTMLSDDCAMTDGQPTLPLEAVRGRTIEYFTGGTERRYSLDHLEWLGQHVEALSVYAPLLQAHESAARELCDNLLNIVPPALSSGLL